MINACAFEDLKIRTCSGCFPESSKHYRSDWHVDTILITIVVCITRTSWARRFYTRSPGHLRIVTRQTRYKLIHSEVRLSGRAWPTKPKQLRKPKQTKQTQAKTKNQSLGTILAGPGPQTGVSNQKQKTSKTKNKQNKHKENQQT